jgi:hypothetical protein
MDCREGKLTIWGKWDKAQGHRLVVPAPIVRVYYFTATTQRAPKSCDG